MGTDVSALYELSSDFNSLDSLSKEVHALKNKIAAAQEKNKPFGGGIRQKVNFIIERTT